MRSTARYVGCRTRHEPGPPIAAQAAWMHFTPLPVEMLLLKPEIQRLVGRARVVEMRRQKYVALGKPSLGAVNVGRDRAIL